MQIVIGFFMGNGGGCNDWNEFQGFWRLVYSKISASQNDGILLLGQLCIYFFYFFIFLCV